MHYIYLASYPQLCQGFMCKVTLVEVQGACCPQTFASNWVPKHFPQSTHGWPFCTAVWLEDCIQAFVCYWPKF